MPPYVPPRRKSLARIYDAASGTRRAADARRCPVLSFSRAPGAICVFLIVRQPSLLQPLPQLELDPAAALPALRRIVSVAYLIPLPLYGSGGLSPRISAATDPNNCRSALSSVKVTWRSTLAVTSGGN